jgi:dipeptidyl aminopeptidase/acylaminoacyl peptidase
VLRREISAAVAALALVAAMTAVPAALAAPGSQLGFVRNGHRSTDIEALDAENAFTTLVHGEPRGVIPFPAAPPTWSGDGGSLTFVGLSSATKKGSKREASQVYSAPADGGKPVAIPGTEDALFALGLPDGSGVAVLKARGQNSESVSTTAGGHEHTTSRTRSQTSLWTVGLAGGRPHRVTPWRPDEIDYPTSASPDGLTLTITKAIAISGMGSGRRKRSQAMLLDLATGRARPVGPGVLEAAYSPDGSKLAIVKDEFFPHPHVQKTEDGVSTTYGQTDIYVEDLASGVRTPVSTGPELDSGPRWDPSGERLAFVRYKTPLTFEAALLGLGDSVYEVNADGTCPTKVLYAPDEGFIGPVWRPGAEHAAGRIAC